MMIIYAFKTWEICDFLFNYKSVYDQVIDLNNVIVFPSKEVKF